MLYAAVLISLITAGISAVILTAAVATMCVTFAKYDAMVKYLMNLSSIDVVERAIKSAQFKEQ